MVLSTRDFCISPSSFLQWFHPNNGGGIRCIASTSSTPPRIYGIHSVLLIRDFEEIWLDSFPTSTISFRQMWCIALINASTLDFGTTLKTQARCIILKKPCHWIVKSGWGVGQRDLSHASPTPFFVTRLPCIYTSGIVLAGRLRVNSWPWRKRNFTESWHLRFTPLPAFFVTQQP